MIDERAKFELSDTPTFLEDEWEPRVGYGFVLVPVSPETLAKLVKLKKKNESIGDCIRRLVEQF